MNNMNISSYCPIGKHQCIFLKDDDSSCWLLYADREEQGTCPIYPPEKVNKSNNKEKELDS